MPQRLAKLLLLRRSGEEVITRGCSALQGKDNAISDVERGDDAFVPFYLSMVPIFMIDANDSF